MVRRNPVQVLPLVATTSVSKPLRMIYVCIVRTSQHNRCTMHCNLNPDAPAPRAKQTRSNTHEQTALPTLAPFASYPRPSMQWWMRQLPLTEPPVCTARDRAQVLQNSASAARASALSPTPTLSPSRDQRKREWNGVGAPYLQHFRMCDYKKITLEIEGWCNTCKCTAQSSRSIRTELVSDLPSTRSFSLHELLW